MIAILSHFQVLVAIGDWSQHEIAVLIQDYAICVEMFLLSIAHIFTFDYLVYRDALNASEEPRSRHFVKDFKPVIKNFASTMSQRDLIHSVKVAYLDVEGAQRMRNNPRGGDVEKLPLLYQQDASATSASDVSGDEKPE